MKCPFCGYLESKVMDSRPTDEGEKIRRRRECLSCKKRFTTYEAIETVPIMVIKKDKSLESFNRAKLTTGIIRACEKRPVTVEQIEQIVANIESELQNSMNKQVTSLEIGNLVMEQLKNLDDVAYVRFASVYRQFGDLNEFMDELSTILQAKKDKNGKD